MTRHLHVLALILSMLVLTACGDTPGDVLPDPREGRSGIHLSGLLDDRQIAISDGLPTINFSDCDVNEGPDQDLCILTRDISGETVLIVFENPAVLVEGARLPVGPGDCSEPRDCDEVTDVAIIDIQFGTGSRVRASSGQLSIDVAEPMQRYRGDVDIRLPGGGGDIRATFDIVPRPDELS